MQTSHRTRVALLVLLSSAVLLSGCTSIGPTITKRSAEELGPYPDDYREIVRRWVEDDLFGVVGIESLSVSKPRSGYADSLIRFKRYGWSTRATIRGVNRMGLPTGTLSYSLLIRDGAVVASQKLIN